MFVGIDPGQNAIHAVVLDEALHLVDAWVLDPRDEPDIRQRLQDADVVAIDAPAALSTAPHRSDASLSPKFRTARRAEIALGRERGIWVPWVTPTSAERVPGWMHVGFVLFAAARAAGARDIEVFPHAGYRTLAGGRLPSKQAAAGLSTRAELLQRAGIDVEGIHMWSHDSLDACLAALIAQQAYHGRSESVTCGHDGSAIWLPSRS